jgi:hypothetical protein
MPITGSARFWSQFDVTLGFSLPLLNSKVGFDVAIKCVADRLLLRVRLEAERHLGPRINLLGFPHAKQCIPALAAVKKELPEFPFLGTPLDHNQAEGIPAV